VDVLTWGVVVLLSVCTRVSTTLGDLVSLWLIRGCAFGPVEASALGDKTSSLDGHEPVGGNTTIVCDAVRRQTYRYADTKFVLLGELTAQDINPIAYVPEFT